MGWGLLSDASVCTDKAIMGPGVEAVCHQPSVWWLDISGHEARPGILRDHGSHHMTNDIAAPCHAMACCHRSNRPQAHTNVPLSNADCVGAVLRVRLPWFVCIWLCACGGPKARDTKATPLSALSAVCGCQVAVAAGNVTLSLGSDTGGSVRIPASYVGSLGMRPTHGRISLAGGRPLAPSFDTVGW